jgi:hypothetical protein
VNAADRPTDGTYQPARAGDTITTADRRKRLAERIETAITDDDHREPRTEETRCVAHVAAGEAMAALAARGDAAGEQP